MKIKHIPQHTDGGGQVELTVEKPSEFIRLFVQTPIFRDVINIMEEPIRYSEIITGLQNGTPFIYTTDVKKRFYYRIGGILDTQWSEPYMRLLLRVTGFTPTPPEGVTGLGLFPETDLTPFIPKPVKATFMLLELKVNDAGSFFYTGIISSEPWNNMDALTYGEKNLRKYIMDEIGEPERCEQEYKANSNGTYSYNHNYFNKKIPSKPYATSQWIWNWLFNWWRNNHANDAQRDALNRHDSLRIRWHGKKFDADYELRWGGSNVPSLVGSGGMHLDDPNGKEDTTHPGHNYSFMKWEELAKLK